MRCYTFTSFRYKCATQKFVHVCITQTTPFPSSCVALRLWPHESCDNPVEGGDFSLSEQLAVEEGPDVTVHIRLHTVTRAETSVIQSRLKPL
mmetsp:Transcript_49094/g.66907  ORF Transcript_49094/g.66907 Transcript_49094/m.66907 type:complete len:92 (-) Transcript_49094:875-1150(-)